MILWNANVFAVMIDHASSVRGAMWAAGISSLETEVLEFWVRELRLVSGMG